MSILGQYQKLDDLILKLTVPPVCPKLRNQLALAREQVEAYQAASDKQDQTLARQAEAIVDHEQKNAQANKVIMRLKLEKEVLKSQVKELSRRAKHIPELRDEIAHLTAELKRNRLEVKTLKSELKLWESGSSQGYYSVSQPTE